VPEQTPDLQDHARRLREIADHLEQWARHRDVVRAAAEERYLGDGLFASFDGYQIWLRAGGDHCVALEPDVVGAFLEFVSEVRRSEITPVKLT
jgi:hypothetical protein